MIGITCAILRGALIGVAIALIILWFLAAH